MNYKIKITSSSNPNNWYADKIGNTYIVDDFDDCWMIIKNQYLIFKDDTLVMKEIKTDKKHKRPRK